MRRLLGVLREEDAERPLTPQPGVAGRRRPWSARPATPASAVGLAVSGTPRRLPAGLGLTVYRIVQEALTNAARHAAGSRRRGQPRGTSRDAVDVAVVDDGGRHGATRRPAAAAACSACGSGSPSSAGTLETGPRPTAASRCTPGLPVPGGGAVIRVLVADDQALIRDSFRLMLDLEPDIEVVGEAGDGEEAVAQTRRLQPDVVLMDVRMPVLDGLGATRALTRAGSPARVLILTTLRRRRVPLRRDARRGVRLPAQGRAPRAARRRRAHGGRRRRAAAPGPDPPAGRAVRPGAAAGGPPPAVAGRADRAGDRGAAHWSAAGCPTPRSRPSCSWARRRSRPTWAAC